MAFPPETRTDPYSQGSNSLSEGTDLGRNRHTAGKNTGLSGFLKSRWLLLTFVSIVTAGAIGGLALLSWARPQPVKEDSAQYHWQQALLALDRDDFLLARTHLNQCLDGWPINAEAHFLMARTCRRAEDEAGWQAHVRKAEILGWDKRSLGLERDLMMVQSGNLRGVEAGLLNYLASLPREEELILESLAKGYLKTDRLNKVLTLTQQWIERYPDHWQPRLFRARALQLMHAVDAAVTEYRRVLDLKPDHAEADFGLAGALLVNSQFQEAADHFQKYLQTHPNESPALLGLANCELSLGETGAARAALDRFFAMHKDEAAGFFLRAKLELAEGKQEEALGWLKKAEARAPHETDITYNLILTLQQLGKQEEAQAYERKLQVLRRTYEQLDSVKAKIMAQPEDVGLRNEAGALALRLGHYEDAGHWFFSALQLDPDHAQTNQLLAEYFQKLGKADVAAYHRRKSQRK